MTDEHSEQCARDPLDEIDETVAQITDEHIEAKLCETLRRAGHRLTPEQDGSNPAQPDVIWLLR